MDPLIRAGIIGCGGIAQVIHLPILHKHPEVEIRAVCDIDIPKATVLAEKFEIGAVYGDIAEMLKQEELDVVFILSPTNLHLPMSLMALDYDVHLFIEKPAAPTAREAARIQKKAETKNKSVMVGMQNRFRSDVMALKKFLVGGDLGNVFFLKGRWLQAKHQANKQPWILQKKISGGGVVLDLGIQLLDLVWWLLDRPNPIGVKAFSYWVDKEMQVEDFCVSCISFLQNTAYSMEVSWDFPVDKDIFSLEIVGDTGTAAINPLKLQKMWHGQLVNITPNVKEDRTRIFKNSYENEINHFINYILGREEKLESPIQEAVRVLTMIDALYKSIAIKKEVALT